MKKSLGLLVAVFMLISAFSIFCNAEVMDTKLFNIYVEPVNDKILDKENDFGEYYLTIENKWTESETFKFVFLDPPNWKEQLIPNPNIRELTVGPGDTQQFHFYVRPSRAYDGVQPVSIIIRSEVTGITFRKGFKIQYGEKDTPAIVELPDPDMDVSISVPAQMDPRNMYNIVVNLKNNNELFLENITVKLSSKNINDETVVSIDPNESKGINLAVLFNEDLPPQKDSLYVSVMHNGKSFYDESHNYEVVEYLPPFDIDVQIKKKIWKRDRTITITNSGNTEKSDSVRLETSTRERWFSKSTPEFEVLKDGNKQYMSWPITLEQNESVTITVKTSYRWLLLPIFLILLYFAYLIKKLNPVIIKKKFQSVKKQHGAVSEMSVAIYLKNTSKYPVTNVRVIERITKMVALKKDSFEGSMHPVKMHSHGREGTLLEYRFAELGPGDERILKYKAHSRLHMFGTIMIKPTVVEFKKRSGVKMKSRSNSITMQTDKVDDEPEKKKKSSTAGPTEHKHKVHHVHKR